jgi:hypothetical protein
MPAQSATAAQTVARSLTASAPSCDSQFNWVADGTGGQIEAIAAVSSSDIWAVGTTRPQGSQVPAPIVEHWDGVNWSNGPIPSGAIGTFAGISAVPGTNNLWAVGGDTAELWNGTSWTVTTLSGAFLSGVVALSATNVWAVGAAVYHYDGASWSVVPIAHTSATDFDSLTSVSATSLTDIWAVGYWVASGQTASHPLIEHWNGTIWSIAPSPDLGAPSALNGVAAVSPSMAWAVGFWSDSTGRAYTLIEKWNGLTWSVVSSPNGTFSNGSTSLNAVAAPSATDGWAVGSARSPYDGINATFETTVIEHWDGISWTMVPSPNPSSPGILGQFNQLAAVVAASPTRVWAAGAYSPNGPNTYNQLFENLCIPPPTVSSVAPLSGNTAGGTAVTVTGTDFRYVTGVSFGGTPATSFTVDSNSQITAVTPSKAAGAVDVTVTTDAGASATISADIFIYVPPAVSWQQYQMSGSDGTTWKAIDMSALSLTLTPTADSNAILGGNADLWTATAGVNQDLGIFVSGGIYASGQLVGWKESGGNAGTFSPNAAFVQTVVPVKAATTYTVVLEWKANHATGGTIFAGAGGSMPFSPTRLTAELVPGTDANLQTAVSTQQYALAGSDGSTWQDIDSALTIPFTPTADGYALLGANADLWTQTAGVNQDLAIFISGGLFSTGQIVGWKESGGSAGTFSPNAAYAQAVVHMTSGTPYVIKAKWKTNYATGATIRVGAGLGPQFSPIRLVLHLFTASMALQDRVSQSQYLKNGSTGNDWSPISIGGLQLAITPSVASLYILGGNADLWTANAGVNQDLGIVVSGGAYGTGVVAAWKESGGFAGTFSPNAAFVQTVLPLAAGTTYTITLVWKANHANTGTIYAGAGNNPFSTTRLTAQLMN